MTVLGTLLGGRYRLDAQIGRGGMSTVYLAFDTVLERPVAIKLLHREIASDSDQLERFRRHDGPLDIPRAIAYAIELARALGAAHERLIVHRDVKPQNVLIGVEGSAKITDFGIARTLTEEGLTVAGRVLGTTDYVSPEQALGQPVTGQSDLYSLGIVLYEMFTGSVPFVAESPVAVAMRHVR